MTNQDFQDYINDLDDLYNFCSEYDFYEPFDERYLRSEDNFRDWLNEYYVGMLCENYGWERIREYLNDVHDMLDSYYWFETSELHPEGVPSSGTVFEDIKIEVYEWAIENDVFDDAVNEENETEQHREIEHTYRETNIDRQEQEFDTQVKWGVAVEKTDEPVEPLPQDDMSLVMCF